MQRCGTAAGALARRTWRRQPPTALHAARCCSTASTKSSHADTAFVFESLVAAPATPESVALRLQQYFAMKELNAVSPTLRHQIVHSPAFVHKLSPLLQWAFQHLPAAPTSSSSSSSASSPQEQEQTDDPAVAVTTAPELDPVAAIFVVLTPWTNIAKDKVWRSFYMRQFFLSRAPLAAFQRALEIHTSVLPAHRASAKETAFLASDLVQEFCARGRFDEAIDAYAQLPLSDRARRDVVQVVHDHEQYASLVALYRAHRTLASPSTAPLDAFPLLHALNALHRHDELNREFQQLSPRDQARADIQELVG